MTKKEIRMMLAEMLGGNVTVNADGTITAAIPKGKTEKPKPKTKPAKAVKATAKAKAKPKTAKAETAEEKPKASKKLLGAFKRILKSGAKSGNKLLAYDFEDAEGYLNTIDGYRTLRTKCEIAERNPLPKEEKAFDSLKMFRECHELNTKPREMPTAEEIKAGIKEAKAKWKESGGKKTPRIFYQFDEGFVINAEYLLDGIEATGATEIFTRESEKVTQPCFMKSEDGLTEYVVLPIYPGGNTERNGQFFPVI